MSARRLAVAAALLATLASAPALAQRVDVEPHWRVGDHVVYRVTHRSVAAQPPRGAVGDPPVVSFALDVLEARDDGFLLSWRVVPPPEVAARAASASADERRMMAAALVPLKLRVDRHAKLLEVANWAQVRDASDELTAASRRYLAERDIPAETLDMLTRSAHARVASEAAVRGSRANEVAVLLTSLGQSYDAAAPVEVEVAAFDPQGGPPLPSTFRFELKALDRAAGTAALRVRQTLSPETLQRMLRETLDNGAKMAGLPAAPPPPDVSVRKLDLAIVYEAVVDLATGWPREARLTKTARGDGGGESVDTLLLERQ